MQMEIAILGWQVALGAEMWIEHSWEEIELDEVALTYGANAEIQRLTFDDTPSSLARGRRASRR